MLRSFGLGHHHWWEKNVSVEYGLSKKDSNDFPIFDDQINKESTAIRSLKLQVEGSDERVAFEGLRLTVSFIRDASTYLELKALLDRYQKRSHPL